MTDSALPPSKRGISVRQEPRSTAAFSPQVSPKTWNSGRQPMITSSGGALQQGLGRGAGVARQVGVGELGALGLPGRARRCRGSPRGRRRPARPARVERLGGHELLRQRRRRRSPPRCPTVPAASTTGSADGSSGDDEPRSRVAQVVLDLARLEQRVHRDDGGAGQQRAVEDDRERRGRWAAPGRRGRRVRRRAPAATPRPAAPRRGTRRRSATASSIRSAGRLSCSAAVSSRFWARLLMVACLPVEVRISALPAREVAYPTSSDTVRRTTGTDEGSSTGG